MSLHRRSLLAAFAGLASLVVTPAVAGPVPAGPVLDARAAQFADLLLQMSADQQAVITRLLSRLRALPEGADDADLFAEAARQLRTLEERS